MALIYLKKIVYKPFYVLGSLFGLIIGNEGFTYHYEQIKAHFFSGLIKNKFSACGKDFLIRAPFQIIGFKCIRIGENFTSFEGLRMEAHRFHNDIKFNPQIKIGDNVSINFDCHIACINNINIGNNVLIASKVFITDHFHGRTDEIESKIPPSQRKLYSKGPVVIEENVWIGENVSIMPGVTLGNNCIVGANSLVTKSFPPNSIIGGIPAKIIKTLKS